MDKNAFCKMFVTICLRLYPNKGGIANYSNQMRAENKKKSCEFSAYYNNNLRVDFLKTNPQKIVIFRRFPKALQF